MRGGGTLPPREIPATGPSGGYEAFAVHAEFKDGPEVAMAGAVCPDFAEFCATLFGDE